jgi:hypothetical protein
VRGRSGNWLVYLDSVKKISGEIMTAKKTVSPKTATKAAKQEEKIV